MFRKVKYLNETTTGKGKNDFLKNTDLPYPEGLSFYLLKALLQVLTISGMIIPKSNFFQQLLTGYFKMLLK